MKIAKFMIIKVEKVIEKKNKTIVDFKSDLGHGSAIWQGYAPTVDMCYEVDVEVHDKLDWGKSVFSSVHQPNIITKDNDDICFIGNVISFNGYSTMYMQLGTNVVTIDMKNPPSDTPEVIECYIRKLVFYPLCDDHSNKIAEMQNWYNSIPKRF